MGWTPILPGQGFRTFTLAKLPRYGFLSMMHAGRTDFSMLMGPVFLLILGAGSRSLDARLHRREAHVQGAGNPSREEIH